MPNFSVWASDEDILEIKKAAVGMDRSVSWYLVDCHRRANGGVLNIPKIQPRTVKMPEVESDVVLDTEVAPIQKEAKKRVVKTPRLSPMTEEPVIDETPDPTEESAVAKRLRQKMEARGESGPAEVDLSEIRKAIDEGKMSYLDAGKKEKK